MINQEKKETILKNLQQSDINSWELNTQAKYFAITVEELKLILIEFRDQKLLYIPNIDGPIYLIKNLKIL